MNGVPIIHSFLNSTWMTLSALFLLGQKETKCTQVVTQIFLTLISMLGVINFFLMIYLIFIYLKENYKKNDKAYKIYTL